MKTFEPVVIDEKINKVLVKAFEQVTYNNFQLNKVNYYTYFCRNLRIIGGKTTRHYLYVLLNEFTRQMYIGITKNIKNRLNTHAKDEVLGPNSSVLLNILFIVELEEIVTNHKVLSINGQVATIEYTLTKHMRNLGYDVRCQVNEMNEQTENGLIESYLLENLNNKFVKQKVKEEYSIIDSTLKEFVRIVETGNYYYFSIYDGEKKSSDEDVLIRK